MNSKNNSDDITLTNTDPYLIKHRKRTSKKQLEVLERTFDICIRPDAKLRKKLGEQLGMTPRAVQIWFQNRRAKVKKITGKMPKRKNIEIDENYNRIEVDENYNRIEVDDSYNTVEVFDTAGMYSKYNNNPDEEYEQGGYRQEYRQNYNNKHFIKHNINNYSYTNENMDNTHPHYPPNLEPKFIKSKYPPMNYETYGDYLPYGEVLYPPTDYPPNDYPPTDYPPNDYPPTDYPPTDYPPTDFAYHPVENYYHKHHDEYYHNMYLDGNGPYKEDGTNVGYPPQYVDMQYYKDYYYKNYPESEEKEKK